jgi:hypothetical protein
MARARERGAAKVGLVIAIVAVALIAGGVAAYFLVLVPKLEAKKIQAVYQNLDVAISALDVDGVTKCLGGGALQEAGKLRTLSGIINIAKRTIKVSSRTTPKKIEVRGSTATAQVERTLEVGGYVEIVPGQRTNIPPKQTVETETHKWQKENGEWKLTDMGQTALSRLLNPF